MSKPGMNAPCPCGSGKKYKKCCFGKAEAEAAQREREQEEAELLLQAMVNLRRSLLDDMPHIKEYRKIRRMHSEIVNSMMDCYDEGKFELQTAANASAFEADDNDGPHVLTLLEADFDPETREGIQALAELVIYKSASNTSCMTEEFLAKHRYRKPEKIAFLQAMLNSRLSLFEITETDGGNGFAILKDVFTGSEHKITDTGMCMMPNFGDIYTYTRIITYQNVSFSTGLSLIFEKSDPFMAQYVRRERETYAPEQEFRRFIELYNRFSRNPQKYKVVPNRF